MIITIIRLRSRLLHYYRDHYITISGSLHDDHYDHNITMIGSRVVCTITIASYPIITCCIVCALMLTQAQRYERADTHLAQLTGLLTRVLLISESVAKSEVVRAT